MKHSIQNTTLNLKACSFTGEEESIKEQAKESLLRNESSMTLATCIRVEDYSLRLPEFEPKTKIWEGLDAFVHLCQTGTGLESRIIGETEILGQLREAIAVYKKGNSDNKEMLKVFSKALQIIRKARKISKIDQNITSAPGIVTRQIINLGVENPVIGIVGSGELAKKLIEKLNKRLPKAEIRIASKTLDHSSGLAKETHSDYFSMENIKGMFSGASIIITATDTNKVLIRPRDIKNTADDLKIFELSQYSNCCLEVRENKKVTHQPLAEIETLAESNTQERIIRAKVAQEVITKESHQFLENGR